MRRLVVLIAVTAFAGAALAAWGGVASAREAGTSATEAAAQKRSCRRCRRTSSPASRWNIAVKCDTPPFGYIGARSQNAGFDVEIARWFAKVRVRQGEPRHLVVRHDARPRARADDRPRRPGHRHLHLQHRPGDAHRLLARVLQGDRPPARQERLDDQLARRPRQGRRSRRRAAPSTTRWVKNCHKDTKLIVTDGFTNALLAFRDGRADALMFDDTILLGIAVTDPTLKLTDDLFLAQPYGIGIKQGNTALKRWVDSRLNIMKKRDLFFPILKNTVPPRQVAPFSKNILRPKQNVRLRPGRHHDGVLVADTFVAATREAAAHAAASLRS